MVTLPPSEAIWPLGLKERSTAPWRTSFHGRWSRGSRHQRGHAAVLRRLARPRRQLTLVPWFPARPGGAMQAAWFSTSLLAEQGPAQGPRGHHRNPSRQFRRKPSPPSTGRPRPPATPESRWPLSFLTGHGSDVHLTRAAQADRPAGTTGRRSGPASILSDSTAGSSCGSGQAAGASRFPSGPRRHGFPRPPASVHPWQNSRTTASGRPARAPERFLPRGCRRRRERQPRGAAGYTGTASRRSSPCVSPTWQDRLSAAMWAYHPCITRHSSAWATVAGQARRSRRCRTSAGASPPTWLASWQAWRRSSVPHFGVPLESTPGPWRGPRRHARRPRPRRPGRDDGPLVQGPRPLTACATKSRRCGQTKESSGASRGPCPRTHGHEFYFGVHDQTLHRWKDGALHFPEATSGGSSNPSDPSDQSGSDEPPYVASGKCKAPSFQRWRVWCMGRRSRTRGRAALPEAPDDLFVCPHLLDRGEARAVRAGYRGPSSRRGRRGRWGSRPA